MPQGSQVAWSSHVTTFWTMRSKKKCCCKGADSDGSSFFALRELPLLPASTTDMPGGAGQPPRAMNWRPWRWKPLANGRHGSRATAPGHPPHSSWAPAVFKPFFMQPKQTVIHTASESTGGTRPWAPRPLPRGPPCFPSAAAASSSALTLLCGHLTFSKPAVTEKVFFKGTALA